MDKTAQLTFAMITRAVSFNDAQPDTDPGHGITADRLKQVQIQMAAAITAQRAGRIQRHRGSVEKLRLKREMLAGPIPYLVGLGELVRGEHPELVTELRYAPAGRSYLAHRTAARGLQAAALAHQDVLAPHGLSEAILEVFGHQLDQFDLALQDAEAGRAVQKSATAMLDTLSIEGQQLVRLLDARNQHRFKNNPNLLTTWLDASTVFGRSKSQGAADTPNPVLPGGAPLAPGSEGTAVASGDIRPAA